MPNDPLAVLEPALALDSTYAMLVAVVLLTGATALYLGRWRPAWFPASQLEARPRLRRSVELVLPLVLLAWGLVVVYRIHTTANPQGLPLANDLHEYLGFVVHWIEPRLGYVPPFRYPLWAWLAARAAALGDLPPYSSGVGISLLSAGLLPLSLYALGRQLAPAGVAFAASMLVVTTPAFQHQAGAPNDYMFATTLMVIALAASCWAVLRGGWLPHLAAGVGLASSMASSYRAFSTIVLALTVILLALAWRAWRERPWVALQAAAVLLPMAALWMVYGRYSEAVSLEAAVMVVHRSMAQNQGATLGWLDYPLSGAVLERTRGTWVVGQPGAISGLPWTLAFMLDASRVGGRFGLPWHMLQYYLRHALNMGWLGWLALALPAGMAAGAWSAPRSGVVLRVLAASLVVAALVVSIGSLRSLPLAYRFFLPSLVLVPGLMLCGASTLLRPFQQRAMAAPLLGLPVALAAAVLAAPGVGTPLAAALDGTRMASQYQLPPGSQPSNPLGGASLLGLSSHVTLDDQVVDMSHHGLAAAFLLGRANLEPRPLRGASDASWSVELQPWSDGRRFIFDACFGNMESHMEPIRQRLLERLAVDPRFERWGPCVVRDLQPDELYHWSSVPGA